jgi:lantibiotic modifying enzyme
LWQVVIEPRLATAALATAKDISLCLRNNELMWAAARLPAQQAAYSHTREWQPATVGGGNAGLVILFAHLDRCFPNEGWDISGHYHLTIAARAIENQKNIPLGLFTGLSGVAFAAWSLSKGGTRYRKLLAALESSLLPRVRRLSNNILEQQRGFAVEQYDLISGLTGMGTYLLSRKEAPEVHAALLSVLTSLVGLSEKENDVLRCYTPQQLISNDEWRNAYPAGYINCGLAHGISGLLALLALAKSCNICVPRMDDAIERIADWLVTHHIDDEWGINWPAGVPLDIGHSSSNLSRPSRTAWCYGSPGVARSLWLTGDALCCARYHEMAMTIMEAVYRRPLSERRIDAPTFCHGVAGLLHITLRFAHDTKKPFFSEAANALTEQLLSLYAPETLLGYYDLDIDGRMLDELSLLNGVAGVVLVLLAASTTTIPIWDRLFLLA